nr:unnamed protein product [Digitaria exilis]
MNRFCTSARHGAPWLLGGTQMVAADRLGRHEGVALRVRCACDGKQKSRSAVAPLLSHQPFIARRWQAA